MGSHPTDAILGSSHPVVSLRADIRRLSAFDAPGNPHVPTVLLLGETGTGKGLVARVIHDSGPRARGPFIDVNCAAIPEAMLEAELFGFEAGAFTDAKRMKPGLFESAAGGTLFLDEVDSLSRPVQSKVLKAIEEKKVRRLGAVEARDVDVKLIAATQADLRRLVEEGAFRLDLYHRLAVLVIEIPPLRQRGEDVPGLAEHFLRTFAEAHGLAPKRLGEGARAWLRSQPWPGNVRELGHLLERVTLLSLAEEVDEATLRRLCAAAPATASSPRPPIRPPEPAPAEAASEEERAIRAALARAGGNVVRAARLLGIGRNALRYRMRRFDIARPDPEEEEIQPAGPTAMAPQAPPPPAPAPPSWEQKPTVVLAVSLSFPGSEEAVGYDPWTQATRWERAVEEIVEGFGGVLAQRSPSRFTAVFGIPRALEQTAQRAVQSAMAMQRRAATAVGPRPDLRTAVHAGEVRIDVNAPDPVPHLVPLGDTLSLAERLLGHAGTGEVLVSAPVARRVDRAFELAARDLRTGHLDSDRMTAYTVLRPLAPAGAGIAPGQAGGAPFVGRERETGILLDAFGRVVAGQGQVGFIAGDAGIGKSRLLAEFRGRLDGVPHRWIEGRCAPYGTATPFLPLADGIRRYLGIDDQDDDAAASAKIEQDVERLGPELAWTLPFVRQLLSLDIADESVRALDAASRRSELFRALRALVLRAAEVEPLVLVIEDLHWVDPASEEFLVFLEEVVPTARVLLLLSHRTGYSTPFADRSYHLRVALPPLSNGDMAAMTGSILGAADIPEELRALIAAKAEGNPFFVEELAKSLVEDGSLRRENGRVHLARPLDEVSVPDRVQDVLIARIDRLAEESRRAIQVASVIGREFALRLLARLTEAGDRVQHQVDELRGLELIYEKALHPELAYMFKHALTHDVAYDSVVVERRKSLHRAIGRVIEDLYADRLAEHYETLAHHYSRGEDWQRALLYHERSADKAADTHANRAVVDHCRRALAIAERLAAEVPDDVRRRLNERLGLACFYLSEYAASGAAYEEAAACSPAGEPRAMNLGAAAFSHFWAHRYESSERCIGMALEMSGDRKAPAAEGLALAVRGFCRGVRDADLDGFEADIARAVELGEESGHEVVEAFARVYQVLSAEWTGDYPTAYARAERAIQLGRKLRRPELIILPSWFLGKARCCTGDYGGAIGILEEGYHLCDRIGDRAWKSRLLNTLGWCFDEIGNVERARDFNERAALLARDLGDPEILSNADINLAMNHLELGHLDRAQGYLEPIERTIAVPGDPWMRWRYAIHVRHARGRIELARGDLGAALAAAEEGLAGARRHRAPRLEAREQLLRARVLLAEERRDAAAEALGAALSIASRIGYRRGLWEAHRGLAEIARRAGERARSAEHLARAGAVAEEAAVTLADDELKRGLRASAVGAISL